MGMKKLLCDGSEVEWTPEWVETECGECGHITGEYDSAKPDFHGKTEKRDGHYFCTRCGEEMVGLAAINALVEEKIAPAIIKEMERVSPFLQQLKKSTTFSGKEFRIPFKYS